MFVEFVFRGLLFQIGQELISLLILGIQTIHIPFLKVSILALTWLVTLSRTITRFYNMKNEFRLDLHDLWRTNVCSFPGCCILQVMLPYNYTEFIDGLTYLVNNNFVQMTRIDDAVKRILRVKFQMGLFENPLADYSLTKYLGSPVSSMCCDKWWGKCFKLFDLPSFTCLARSHCLVLLIAINGAPT